MAKSYSNTVSIFGTGGGGGVLVQHIHVWDVFDLTAIKVI